MPFPEVQRVIYRKNPLDQVVCQLRFPPILRIDSEIPAKFQDAIRSEFPNYSEGPDIRIEIAEGIPEAIAPEMLKQLLQPIGNKNYEFSSEDGHWKINLTRTFIALTTSNYERWENFSQKLKLPLQALLDIYAPTQFSRVGLRYVDVIRRSRLNLREVGWGELLKPYILGIIASPEVGNHAKVLENRCEISLADERSIVRIVTRLVEATDEKEMCFMVDSDFFDTKKTDFAGALEKLEFFRERGTRLFQWCITDKLHNAMEPQPL